MPADDPEDGAKDTQISRMSDGRVWPAAHQSMVLPDAHLERKQATQFAVASPSNIASHYRQEHAYDEGGGYANLFGSAGNDEE